MIYIKHFLFYARIKYQFKASELKNVDKSVKKTVQALKVLLEWTGNVHFCTICEIAFLVHESGTCGTWSLKSPKLVAIFLYKP